MNKSPLKRFVLLFTIMCFVYSNAQNQIQGIVKSNRSLKELPYVNIGIVGKSIGTVSNDKGFFEINISEKHYLDSLKISMIGYNSKIFLVSDFVDAISEDGVILLQEKTQYLDEVVISNKKLKQRVLGNRTRSKLFADGFESDKLGCEAGIIIKIKKSPTYVKKFTASIVENEHKEIKFRLNFYDLKDEMPNDNILNESIIFTSTIKEGLMTVNLEEYDIVMHDDFFVSLEWIEYFGPGNLDFSIGLLGSPVIYRETSQANWQKIKGIGPGFTVTAAH